MENKWKNIQNPQAVKCNCLFKNTYLLYACLHTTHISLLSPLSSSLWKTTNLKKIICTVRVNKIRALSLPLLLALTFCESLVFSCYFWSIIPTHDKKKKKKILLWKGFSLKALSSLYGFPLKYCIADHHNQTKNFIILEEKKLVVVHVCLFFFI